MKPLPFPVRLAAGIAVSASERAKKLPRQVAGLPITVASQALQAGMRVQQQVTELVIKGDEALSSVRPAEETPEWATFDEDIEEPPARPHRTKFDEVTDDTAEAEDADDPPKESLQPARPRWINATFGGAPSWLSDYDSLSLPQLRARLPRFTPDQLAELLAYERSGANREEFTGMLTRRIAKIADITPGSDGPS